MAGLPLYKVLVLSKISSRRKCTQAIKEGQVKVDERIIKDPLFLVDCKKDSVSIKGRRLDIKEIFKKKFVYYLLNKPQGYICTVKDTHNRKTVLELIKKEDKRIYPVGRLDKDTEGLLILTNDGNLTYRLIHPKFEIDKTYETLIAPRITKVAIKKLEKGVIIDKGIRVSAKVRLIKDYKKKNQTKLEVIIHQGIKRQIRRMFVSLGYEVNRLVRTRLGTLELGDLKKGKARQLSYDEINSLKKLVGVKYDEIKTRKN